MSSEVVVFDAVFPIEDPRIVSRFQSKENPKIRTVPTDAYEPLISTLENFVSSPLSISQMSICKAN